MKKHIDSEQAPPNLWSWNRKLCSYVPKYISALAIMLLVIIPFHTVITTWAASLVGHFDIVRIWKEVLLVLLVAVFGWYVAYHRHEYRGVWQERLVRAAVAYLVVVMLLAVYGLLAGNTTYRAAAHGVIIAARGVVFFLLIYLLGRHHLRARWRPVLLVPALIVAAFGLLQMFVLPADVLQHAGYGTQTIPAYQLLDNKPDLPRIQSVMRGPNPLGAYLVVIIAAAAVLFLRHIAHRNWYGALLAVLAVVLFGTYSRSALLGVITAVAVLAAVLFMRRRPRLLVASALVLLVVGSGGIVLFRDNDTIQNYVFHTNERSGSPQSSNAVRFAALRGGVADVASEPFGRGIGSAGPASVRNGPHGARISENYFLQIGQEAGLLGLGLFAAILVGLSRRLWALRRSSLGLAMLAALAGLVVVNMLSHAWADDTLAYIFWGFAAIALTHKPAHIVGRTDKAKKAAS